jgi:hypothetical protein
MSTRGPDGPDDPPPEQTRDDTALGWGDESPDQAEADRDAWYLAEKPPHHGD